MKPFTVFLHVVCVTFALALSVNDLLVPARKSETALGGAAGAGGV